MSSSSTVQEIAIKAPHAAPFETLAPSDADKAMFADYAWIEDTYILDRDVKVVEYPRYIISWAGSVAFFPDTMEIEIRAARNATPDLIYRLQLFARKLQLGWWPLFIKRDAEPTAAPATGRNRWVVPFGYIEDSVECNVVGCHEKRHEVFEDGTAPIHYGEEFTRSERETEDLIYTVQAERRDTDPLWTVYISVARGESMTAEHAASMASDLAWVSAEVNRLNAAINAQSAVAA